MNRVFICFLLSCFLFSGAVHASEIKVTARGSCAISGITAEQAQALALRRARSAAVEQAAGVSVTSASVVTDGRLAGSFIKSFSQGYIIEETVQWEPVGSYLPDPSKPPIIEYRVKLDAVVMVPDKGRPALGLHATLNQKIFRAHKDKLTITTSTVAPSRIAVFNITADDQVMMLYPERGHSTSVADGHKLVFPTPNNGGELLLGTLPGHTRDAEAIFVAALEDSAKVDWSGAFAEGQPMPLTVFFKRYAAFAAHCEDTILPYEVFTE